jgi:P-type conjugative transfer protein TrbJ
MNRISRLAAIGAVVLTVSLSPPPSLAQVVVFDPNNYAQNVLTAARALQQINNQITSLQNQTQMLINQARISRTCHFRHCSNCNRRSSAPSSF